MATLGKIDIITKMHRSMPFNSSNQMNASQHPTVYKIERVATADSYRVIYGVEVPRAIEISGLSLASDFNRAMRHLARDIQNDASNIQRGPPPIEPKEIEIEASL